MKKSIFKLSNYQIVKLFFSLVLITLIINPIVKAQDASESSDVDTEVKEKIKEKLEQVVDNNLENIKGVLADKITNKIYGYSGEVIDIKNGILTLNTYLGNYYVEVASKAAILKYSDSKTKSNIEANEIEKNDFLIAMGPKKNNDEVLAKRIIVSTLPSPPPSRKLLSGKVTEVDKSKVKFAKNGDEETITVGSKTKLKINGMEKSTTEDIQIGDYFYTIVTLDEDDKIDEVKYVLVMPGTSSPAAEENTIKEATPASAEEETETTEIEEE